MNENLVHISDMTYLPIQCLCLQVLAFRLFTSLDVCTLYVKDLQNHYQSKTPTVIVFDGYENNDNTQGSEQLRWYRYFAPQFEIDITTPSSSWKPRFILHNFQK